VIGNGDVKEVAAFQRMRAATGCDNVMIGRGAMGNPWLFRSLAAIARGEPDPGPPTLAERAQVWRRHADLALAHAPEKMRVHELRKTLAWYSRGLYGGSQLRQRCGATTDISELCDMGAAFFADLCRFEDGAGSDAPVFASPADPVAKAIARNVRRSGPDQIEADEPRAASPAYAELS
jgi:tRNA-dihydrouridine synthase